MLMCAPRPAPLQWDPLGLGANEERLTWFAEAERVHARWAMLAVAGILVQVGCRIELFLHENAAAGMDCDGRPSRIEESAAETRQRPGTCTPYTCSCDHIDLTPTCMLMIHAGDHPAKLLLV